MKNIGELSKAMHTLKETMKNKRYNTTIDDEIPGAFVLKAIRLLRIMKLWVFF